MYQRTLAPLILAALEKYRAVVVTGPRQSGKTTLVRSLFPKLEYLSLENPDLRRLALDDPRGFLAAHPGSLILDEVQRAPELLSYLQGLLDEPASPRRFILTGSQNLLLIEKVSQTLAGRTRVFTLLPLSQRELDENRIHQGDALLQRILHGGYPRIFEQELEPSEWLAQYYMTYVERDVRTLSNIGDLDLFDRFVRLVAGRTGQLLNLSSLGSDCGVSQPTAGAWLSVLKTSFVCFTLEPHFRNFSKRLIKSPKVYFFDTGLLCYLLRTRTPDQLRVHPLQGAIFENWVIVEAMKAFFNAGREAPLYFWRDTKGHEVDLVVDCGSYLFPVEIKAAATFDESFISNIEYLNALQRRKGGTVAYGGDSSFPYHENEVCGWSDWPARLPLT